MAGKHAVRLQLRGAQAEHVGPATPQTIPKMTQFCLNYPWHPSPRELGFQLAVSALL